MLESEQHTATETFFCKFIRNRLYSVFINSRCQVHQTTPRCNSLHFCTVQQDSYYDWFTDITQPFTTVLLAKGSRLFMFMFLTEIKINVQMLIECKNFRYYDSYWCYFLSTLRLWLLFTNNEYCCQPLVVTVNRQHTLICQCKVLSLSDCKYSLNPLSQTWIDRVGQYRIRCTFKLSYTWRRWRVW